MVISGNKLPTKFKAVAKLLKIITSKIKPQKRFAVITISVYLEAVLINSRFVTTGS